MTNELVDIVDHLSDYRNRAGQFELCIEDFIVGTNGLSRQSLICLSNLVDDYQSHLKEAISETAGVCLVCQESAESDLVWCKACRTVHHSGCWTYVGKCSMFGCGSVEIANL